jgi:serine protease inhibitor
MDMTRRRRYSVIAVLAVIAALVAVLLPRAFGGSDGHPHPGPTHVAVGPNVRIADRIGSAEELVSKRTSSGVDPSPRDVQSVADADTAFGIDLLQRLQTTSDDNLSLSPMSLALALTMLQNGASGKTLAGIRSALHSGDLDGRTSDAGWSALVKDWTAAAASSGFSLQSANSLWLAPGLSTRPAFMDALATYFHSGVWRLDFDKPGATDAINKWTSDQTHGRITKLFDHLDPATRAVLANAVYFKAAWQQPFDPNDTQPGPFTGADGVKTQASFMSSTTALPCSVTDDYQAVQLPYKGGRFAALAIMPTHETLDNYVHGLNTSALQKVAAGLHPTGLQLDMPKFTTSSTLDLKSPLMAMGMDDAFGGGADFSALSPQALQVDQVVQRVYLKVAEKGTEAAAATGISMIPTSAMGPSSVIVLDHPFLFLIRDTKTGAILFASEVQHPAS